MIAASVSPHCRLPANDCRAGAADSLAASPLLRRFLLLRAGAGSACSSSVASAGADGAVGSELVAQQGRPGLSPCDRAGRTARDVWLERRRGISPSFHRLAELIEGVFQLHPVERVGPCSLPNRSVVDSRTIFQAAAKTGSANTSSAKLPIVSGIVWTCPASVERIDLKLANTLDSEGDRSPCSARASRPVRGLGRLSRTTETQRRRSYPRVP